MMKKYFIDIEKKGKKYGGSITLPELLTLKYNNSILEMDLPDHYTPLMLLETNNKIGNIQYLILKDDLASKDTQSLKLYWGRSHYMQLIDLVDIEYLGRKKEKKLSAEEEFEGQKLSFDEAKERLCRLDFKYHQWSSSLSSILFNRNTCEEKSITLITRTRKSTSKKTLEQLF